MIRHIPINAEATTNSTSNTVTTTICRDQYGAFCVSHSGDRLASSSTLRVMLQGSFDQSAWFTIETVSPADDDYQRQPTGTPINFARASWVRVVQLMPFLRVQIINGGGLTFTAMIVE